MSTSPGRTEQPALSGPNRQLALATDGVGVSIGGVRILDDVSIRVRRGEIMAILGPNGAGKTTLFNVVTGLRKPTAGRVLLSGTDITGVSVPRRARMGLARSFQITSLFHSLTVLENVRLAAQARRGGSLIPWRRVKASDPAEHDAMTALELVGIAGSAGEIAASLPHGAKRKLDVAMAIVGEPGVLLLDEPTAGMSAEDVPELAEVIVAIRDTIGTTVVLIEHRMDVALRLADRMCVMHHGRLVACDTPDAVMADPQVQAAYLGETW